MVRQHVAESEKESIFQARGSSLELEKGNKLSFKLQKGWQRYYSRNLHWILLKCMRPQTGSSDWGWDEE